MTKGKTGTREWSDVSVNCCLGCSNACVYCYAREGPQARYQQHGGAKWAIERPMAAELVRHGEKFNKRYGGVVMFPTAHDITPGTRQACLAALHQLILAGNRVLVVSKLQNLGLPYLIGTIKNGLAQLSERTTARTEYGRLGRSSRTSSGYRAGCSGQ
jgi:DNA repair photolyase